MFVVWLVTVVQDGIQGGQVAGHRMEPGIDVLRLDRDDAAVVSCCGNFRRRLVGLYDYVENAAKR